MRSDRVYWDDQRSAGQRHRRSLRSGVLSVLPRRRLLLRQPRRLRIRYTLFLKRRRPAADATRLGRGLCDLFLLSGFVRAILKSKCPIETPLSAHSSSIDFLMRLRLLTGLRSRWRRASKRSMRFFPDMDFLAAG